MRVSIIAAIANNNVIGYNNALPWHLPADLKFFKEKTMGKIIVMARKTFESIGKPLPRRINVVLTRNKDLLINGVEVYRDWQQILEKYSEQEIIVIGGEKVYSYFLPIANIIYLTIIDGDFKGDSFFPDIDTIQWKEISNEQYFADEKNLYNYKFVTLKRIAIIS